MAHVEESLAASLLDPSLKYPGSHKVDVLEILAYPGSQLTEAVKQLNGRAMRFTAADGDLATFEGQRRLYELIHRAQPKHIMVTPECGPWSSWSRFNRSRGIAAYEKVQQARRYQLTMLRLCARLCAYQVSLGRHFHIEQPGGSEMCQQSCMAEVVSAGVHVDMCRFGLRLPGSSRLIRKSTEIRTTSSVVAKALEGRTCTRDHPHQPIQGSFRQNGRSIDPSRCQRLLHPTPVSSLGSWQRACSLPVRLPCQPRQRHLP